jgi:hypothetical protein
VDEDLRAAAFSRWSGLASAVLLVPANRVYSGSVPAFPVPPYMQLDSRPGGERRYQTDYGDPLGGDYLDPRVLIVRAWGVEADVKAIGEKVIAAMKSSLTLASGTVLWSMPQAETLTEDAAEYQGNLLWRWEGEFACGLQRQLPAAPV